MESQLSLFGFSRNGQKNFHMERLKEVSREGARLTLKVCAGHRSGLAIRANYQLQQ
jgi:pyridoxine 5'-phosphate synthase PdxJ